MTNSTKTSAQNGSMNQSAQTNPLAAMNNAIVNSKLQESMNEYGTYTATSDANNEYPPKNQSGNSMTQSSQQNQNASSAMQNNKNTSMTSSNQSASGTLTAQYDANNKP